MAMASKSKHRRQRSLLRSQNETCPDCWGNLLMIGFQIHHLFPKSLGGADALYNLVLLCPSCHAARHR